MRAFASTKEFFYGSFGRTSDLSIDSDMLMRNYLMAIDGATNFPHSRTMPGFKTFTPVTASTVSSGDANAMLVLFAATFPD